MTLRVKFEIVPHGNEDEVREIGRINIHNMGIGTIAENGNVLCDYRIESHGEGLPEGEVDWIRNHAREKGYLALATQAVNIVDNVVLANTA